MGRTARGGLAHKIKTYGAQFWSTCTARQSEDILTIKEDIFGYDRYRIPCKYLPYNRIDLDLNRPVTLPSRLYKAGRDPLECIWYSIQSTEDTGRRVLRRSDGLNLSKSLCLCAYVAIRLLLRAPPPIHLLPWAYPLVDCRPDFVDSDATVNIC